MHQKFSHAIELCQLANESSFAKCLILSRLVPLVLAIGALVASMPSSAANDTCLEDGGAAMCIGPEIGPWLYTASNRGAVTSDRFMTEAEALADFRQKMLASAASGGKCPPTLTNMFPAWLDGPVPMGKGGENVGNEAEAIAGTGPYATRSWILGTIRHQSKMPIRIDDPGYTSPPPPCSSPSTYGGVVSRVRVVQCPDNPHGDGPTTPGLWYSNTETPPTYAYCWKWPSRPEKKKNLGSQCTTAGNPVNVASGNKFESHTDYRGYGAMPLHFTRTYNSGLWAGSSAPQQIGNYWSNLGYNWRSQFDARINLSGAGRFSTVYAYRPDGRTLYFKIVQEVYTPDKDISDSLTQMTDGAGNFAGWRYTVAETEDVETYDASGRLVAISNRAGLKQTLAYDGADRLVTVSDDFGRKLMFEYNLNNQLERLIDPAGNSYTYTYNSVGNLS